MVPALQVVAVREEYVSVISPIVTRRVKLVVDAARGDRAVKGRKSGDNNVMSLPDFGAVSLSPE